MNRLDNRGVTNPKERIVNWWYTKGPGPYPYSARVNKLVKSIRDKLNVPLTQENICLGQRENISSVPR